MWPKPQWYTYAVFGHYRCAFLLYLKAECFSHSSDIRWGSNQLACIFYCRSIILYYLLFFQGRNIYFYRCSGFDLYSRIYYLIPYAPEYIIWFLLICISFEFFVCIYAWYFHSLCGLIYSSHRGLGLCANIFSPSFVSLLKPLFFCGIINSHCAVDSLLV